MLFHILYLSSSTISSDCVTFLRRAAAAASFFRKLHHQATSSPQRIQCAVVSTEIMDHQLYIPFYIRH